MIKIFEMNEKMNAVDSNNNLVGFSLTDDCCAHGGYFVTDKIITKDYGDFVGMPDKDFPNHVFDTKFFEEHNENDGEGGGVVVFKLIKHWLSDEDNVPVLYLHLYNCHNGYYSKGFKYAFDEVKTGSI